MANELRVNARAHSLGDMMKRLCSSLSSDFLVVMIVGVTAAATSADLPSPGHTPERQHNHDARAIDVELPSGRQVARWYARAHGRP